MKCVLIAILLLAASILIPNCSYAAEKGQEHHRHGKVPLIFDTDMGNDVDDALALGVIHALQSRGECELLAVTITKDHAMAAPFVDAVNTFYGRGTIPIGVCRGSGKTPDEGKYNSVAKIMDHGKARFPHDLDSSDSAPTAVEVLRKTLSSAQDHSVVFVQVGFSTNLNQLLLSPSDGVSPLSGRELIRQKVRLVSIMAGAFQLIRNDKGVLAPHPEYNVEQDLAAIQSMLKHCEVPIWWSGFEIGLALAYPHQSILHDYRYVEHHPLPEAYIAYLPPPHDRPTWDLTSVLVAVRPDRGYFELSPPGVVEVADNAITTFKETADGKHRFLILKPEALEKTREALVQLASQPPTP